MLEGLLVDLVPYGERFLAHDPEWKNSEARFWFDEGNRLVVSRAQVEAWRRAAEESDAPLKMIVFGIQLKDQTPIGVFVINWIVPHCRLAMLGAAIYDSDYWGRGYGTDALLLGVDYAFEWLDMRKIWLGTMGNNVRVQRQMAKVGFTLEARRREGVYGDGAYHDDLFYGLLREEWPGRDAVIERLGLQAR